MKRTPLRPSGVRVQLSDRRVRKSNPHIPLGGKIAFCQYRFPFTATLKWFTTTLRTVVRAERPARRSTRTRKRYQRRFPRLGRPPLKTRIDGPAFGRAATRITVLQRLQRTSSFVARQQGSGNIRPQWPFIHTLPSQPSCSLRYACAVVPLSAVNHRATDESYRAGQA
jgi:hypothetical protein